MSDSFIVQNVLRDPQHLVKQSRIELMHFFVNRFSIYMGKHRFFVLNCSFTVSSTVYGLITTVHCCCVLLCVVLQYVCRDVLDRMGSQVLEDHRGREVKGVVLGLQDLGDYLARR